jgi:hypothetical protein
MVGLAALIAGQQQPALSPPAPVAGGVIAGTVVDAATGGPISGAVVHIQLEKGDVPSSLQMTDAKGRFLFSNLPAGSYTIRTSKAGYSEGAYGRDADSGVTSTPVTIDNSQPFTNGRIAMAKPSSISGLVTDEAGEPMVNVFVRALRVVMMSGVQHVASGKVVSTDDRGAYRLTGLTPGRYIVMLPSVSASAPAGRAGELLARSRDSASRSSVTLRTPKPDGVFAGESNYVIFAGAYPLPPGRELRAYPPLFHPAGRAIAEALPIAVAPGEQRSGINFVWAPVAASLVSGRLNGPGDTAARMIVRLAPIGTESLPPGSEAATTIANADGSFVFLRVPHGEYTLIASRSYAYFSDGDGRVLPRPPGFMEGWGGGSSIPGSDVGYSYISDQTNDTHTARQPLSVSGESVNGVSVQLRPNVRLSGRVVIESGAFVLSGASGGGAPPPPNGPVRAEPANGDLTLGLPGGMFDSTRGTFYVEGLQPGEYTIWFMGLPMIKTITVGGDDYTTRPINTTNGGRYDDVVVTVTDKVATISGTARSADGALVPAAVLYFPTDRAQWSRYGLRPLRVGAAPVSSTGTYKVDVPAGEYFVLAVPAAQTRLWQDSKRLEAAATLATRVRVAWDQKHTETLTVREIK